MPKAKSECNIEKVVPMKNNVCGGLYGIFK